ncbi:MAG: substrate-binding domain-containing protein [Magnetococcales bacterium]|nr:substrate-binding domain-containing protein [Magnetococcales bacterium]
MPYWVLSRKIGGGIDPLTVAILLLFTAFFFSSPLQAQSRQTVVIPGTGMFERALRHVAKRFNEQSTRFRVEIPVSVGSGGGIRKVLAGEASMARVGRPLNPKEKAQDSNLQWKLFAYDAVVFAVGRRVKVKQRSIDQLKAIFEGRSQRWETVDGREPPIRVITREPGDASLMVIQRHLLPFANYDPLKYGRMVFHDYEMEAMLKKFGYAISWGSLSTIQLGHSGAKPLAIGTMTPTLDQIVSGAYPLRGPCALVYNPEKLRGPERAFLSYLGKKGGRDAMREAGLVPLKVD